jgi:hypothetical protein
MANRNVPKIEWSTEITVTRPQPVPVTKPLPDDTELKTILEPLDFAPLRKAGILTVGQLRANKSELTSIKGIGYARSTKVFAVIDQTEGWKSLPDFHDTSTTNPNLFQPFADAFKALDLALEISKKLLILSTGYPKILKLDDRTFIVIRWGLCPQYQSFTLRLRRQDPRFHACPPLNSQDTGMIECWKEPE